MRIGRGVWVGAVLVAVAAACSHEGDGSFPEETGEGGAPHYDGGGGDATQQASGNDGAAGEASPSPESGADSASGEEGSTGHEAGSDDAGKEGGSGTSHEGGVEPEAGAAEAGVDAGVDAPAETGVDAATDAPDETSPGQDAGSDASTDAGNDAPSIVAPVCDGVIGAGEYGGAGNQAASTNGQTWYMTWDATHLYVAIANANVDEGNVLYVAVNPANGTPPAGGSTSGELYDSTDVTTLPFAAQLAVYAHDGYTEARIASGGAWGNPDTTSAVLCDNATTQVREEVIPWSLVGGSPAAFGWTGYLAADGNQNPQGYIYGQMPTDDPGGGPANDDTFTKYFNVPDATVGVGLPFANEN